MEALSIGCLWFARRADALDDLDEQSWTPASHIGKVKRALENLENLTDLQINGNENTYSGASWPIEDDPENNNFFPIYSFLSVEFNLFIPKRLHEQYLLFDDAADVETFRVRILYDDDMPVAYISYSVNGSKEQVSSFKPSNAVVVVRKYLEEKLKNDPIISFQCLGPSPCWVDAFLEKKASEETEEAMDLSDDEGYRTFYYRVEGSTPDDCVTSFIADNHRVLAEFYMLVRLRNGLNRLASSVINGAMELLQPAPSGRWAALKHWWGFKDEIDVVFASLLTEKLERVAMEEHEANLIGNEAVDRTSLFYSYIDKELANRRRPAVDEDIRELLIMLEDRRRGYFENLSTLFSGLVGGLLGAALGAFLTVGLGDHGAKQQDKPIAPATDRVQDQK